MRRRRSRQTLTLFAFQDIITGVAGVMLFILLLLVVQLTIRTAAAVEESNIPTDQKPEQTTDASADASVYLTALSDLQQAKEKLNELRRQNDKLLKANRKNVDAEIRAVESELAELIREADQRKAQSEAMMRQAESQNADPERQAILEQRNELNQKLEQLRKERQRHGSGKLVAFKSSSQSDQNLWVVDLYDVRALLFSLTNTEEVIEIRFERETEAAAVSQLIKDRLAEQTRQRRVVLVLRPSIAGKAMEVMAAMRGDGFQFALELLDEDTMIAQDISSPDDQQP